MPSDAQRLRIKEMLVEQLQLRMEPTEIGDSQGLFDPEGLGLDSVDAIEVVAGVETEFGYAIQGEDQARELLKDVETLAAFLEQEGKL